MSDYRIDFIQGKIAGQPLPTFAIAQGKMMVRCSDGFEFEVVPVMARSMTSINKETNEITTITKGSISVKVIKNKKLEQLKVPGVNA